MIRLYDYYRSSSAYRVRIALYLKSIPFESVHIDLLKNEHKADAYKTVNPQGVVPYMIDGGFSLGQSLAMIEYLDEAYAGPPMVRGTPEDKAYIRQLSNIIACDIHPLNNPKVFKAYLGGRLGVPEEQTLEWYRHWITEGLNAFQSVLQSSGKSGKCCFGNEPSMADLCLLPQLYNARRFNMDVGAWPQLAAIEKHCLTLPAFQLASPERHPNAPADLPQIHGTRAA